MRGDLPESLDQHRETEKAILDQLDHHCSLTALRHLCKGTKNFQGVK